MGVVGGEVHNSNSGWDPVYVDDNLSVMSIGFLLGDPDDAVIWRGAKKHGTSALHLQFTFSSNPAILERNQLGRVGLLGHRQYLQSAWCNSVAPPGTSDEHISIVNFLKDIGIDGGILVTTPQEVALADVRKEIRFCQRSGIKIVGVVENMSEIQVLHLFELGEK